MTDAEKLAELRNRITEAAQFAVLMPMMGAGLNVRADVVVALPPIVWDAILEELDRE